MSSHCTRAGTLVIALMAIFIGNDARAADTDRVTALADRYVEAYKSSFPIGYELFGLPVERSDGIDINAPADIERWHRLNEEMAGELATIRPEGLIGQAEWVTWQFLNQALSQDRSTAVCRSELWGVSPGGWQSALKLIAHAAPEDVAGLEELHHRIARPVRTVRGADHRDGARVGEKIGNVFVTGQRHARSFLSRGRSHSPQPLTSAFGSPLP